MAWGTTDRRACIDWWKARIGDAPGMMKANGDVFLFILSELFTFLPGKRKKGYWGWKFMEAGEINCQRIWAYVDGQSSDSQCNKMGSPTIWKEDWRPCVIVPEMGQVQLAYYDADLVWNDSRPWGCDIGRLREDLHYPPPPPALEDDVDKWDTVD